MKDWVFGLTMAAAVALYRNLIDAVLYYGGADRSDAKSWLIFFATAGPAVLGPILFGVRPSRERTVACLIYFTRPRMRPIIFYNLVQHVVAGAADVLMARRRVIASAAPAVAPIARR